VIRVFIYFRSVLANKLLKVCDIKGTYFSEISIPRGVSQSSQIAVNNAYIILVAGSHSNS